MLFVKALIFLAITALLLVIAFRTIEYERLYLITSVLAGSSVITSFITVVYLLAGIIRLFTVRF